MPLFSIVIPVKDRSTPLRRALLSLRGQAFKNFEVIVVDDGSSEDLLRVTSQFSDLDIRLIRQEQGVQGACAARNLGSDEARGTYIAYLDSDDVFLSNKLQVMAEVIESERPDLIASFLLVYRGTSRLQLRPLRPPKANEEIDEYYFVSDQRIQSSSIVVHRKLFQQTRWNESLRKVQDPDFFIRAAKRAERLRFIENPLAVLFDDEIQGRVSSASAEHNLRAWLDSDSCPLSDKSKSGFRFYALAHEVSKRSRWEALQIMGRNRKAVGLKTQIKALYRLLVPEAMFKWTATLIHGRTSEDHLPHWQQVAYLIQKSLSNA